MSNDYSSFDKDKKIFDGWRHFLNESSAPGMTELEEQEKEKDKDAKELERAKEDDRKLGSGPLPDWIDREAEKIKDRYEKREDEQTQTNEQKETETHGSGSEDVLTPGKKAKSKPLPKDYFKGKPPEAVPLGDEKELDKKYKKEEGLNEQAPAGIDIDPAAQAAMEQRPEFGDLGVDGDTYITADMEQLKLGSDYDFLDNRTPLPSLRTAHMQGLIDPGTNKLTDLGRGVVRGWKEKHGSPQALQETLSYVVQEVYKRLTTEK